MVVDGVEYFDEDAELFPDGSIHDATIARDTEIQGLLCTGGCSVVFFPGGRLRLAYLARNSVIAGLMCASGVVYLYESGKLMNATLASDCAFAYRTVPASERVTLDEGGQLLEFSRKLEVDKVIRGLHCAAAFRVWCYADGRPSVAVLASPSIVRGEQYPRGVELFLDEDGQVLDWNLADLDSGTTYKQRVFGVYGR